MKKYLKENYKQILCLLLFAIIVNIPLPYYIEAPGGTINLTKRIEQKYDSKNGSLNMLYVAEYRGNIVTVLLGKILKNWDLYKTEEHQISDESESEIYARNRLMLENSINNATYVAYKEAGQELNISKIENLIIATTKDNGLKIGDNVLKIDNIDVDNIMTIKNHLQELSPKDTVNVTIERNGKEKNINITLEEDKMLGIMLITNYNYEVPNEIPQLFRSGEGGASGGMILSLGIYSYISGEDIPKGRKIAGTGTIDIDGNIGEIDGVKHKIMGAVKNKMDIVLVSQYNYEEAKKIVDENHYNIELVEVKTLREAIDYLTQ